MIKLRVKSDKTQEIETLVEYCAKLSKKNNSILYKLEDYLGKKLLIDEDLSEIRDTILSVSAEINKLHKVIIVSEGD